MSDNIKRNLIHLSIAASQFHHTAYEQGFRWAQALFRSIGPGVATCDMTDIFQNEMEWRRSDLEALESDPDSNDSEIPSGNTSWKWNGTAAELLDLMECAIVCQYLFCKCPDKWYDVLRQPDKMTDTAKKIGLTHSVIKQEMKRLFIENAD